MDLSERKEMDITRKRLFMARLLYLLLFFIPLCSFSQAVLPTPDHIVILVMENHSYNQIIGSKEAPHINVLAKSPNTALFTQSYGVANPSQPNYITLFSGCNQGITNDAPPNNIPFTSDNLASQLLDSDKTFISYAEDLPHEGYEGEVSGAYVRRHNPAVYWMGNGTNQLPPSVIQPFSAFPENFALLPTLCFVVPNNANNMHDGSISTGDKWIYSHFSTYIEWAKTHHSLFILTFDEDDEAHDNHITTLFSGEMVQSGIYSQKINHLNVLRTIEEMYGLPYACDAAKVDPVTVCWNTPIGNHSQEEEKLIRVIPDPILHTIKIYLPNDSLKGDLKFSLLNTLGEKVKEFTLKSFVTSIPSSELSAGVYIYQVTRQDKLLRKGKIVIP